MEITEMHFIINLDRLPSLRPPKRTHTHTQENLSEKLWNITSSLSVLQGVVEDKMVNNAALCNFTK